jgi:hypothetical protein
MESPFDLPPCGICGDAHTCPKCQAIRQDPTAQGGVVVNGKVVPLYFCLYCEQPRAISMSPLEKPEANFHHCLECKQTREVDCPIPPNSSNMLVGLD